MHQQAAHIRLVQGFLQGELPDQCLTRGRSEDMAVAKKSKS